MEIIIVIAIILVLCLILGVSLNYILFGITILAIIFFGLMAIGFSYCIIRVLFSKRKEAQFVRFGKASNGRFQVACYLVEGKEYPCIFPKEFVMENKLYSVDKTYNVMLDRKANKVYDQYAIATCVLGLLFGIGFCVVMGMIWFGAL